MHKHSIRAAVRSLPTIEALPLLVPDVPSATAFVKKVKSAVLALLIMFFVVNFVHAQVGQKAGIGVYGGTAFLSHVRRGDDYKGRYTPDESMAYCGGIGIYQPLTSVLGLGLELGYQQNQFDYRYNTDRISIVVYNQMKFHSVTLTPSLTINPPFLKGFFARLAVPIAVPAGNSGTYTTISFDFVNPPQYTDLSAKVAGSRRISVGPEISLGYMYTWKNGNGIWVRGSTWRASTEFWKPSFTETPELPTLKRLSIELGFRIGTPSLRLFGRNNLNQAQPFTE